MPGPSFTLTTVHYTIAAALGAAALFYVFGPTILPDDERPADRKSGAVGLTNAANDCFINAVLQALAGSPVLRKYLDERISPGNADGVTKELADDNSTPSSLEVGDDAEPKVRAINIVTTALRDILDRLHDPALNGKSISAYHFIRALEYAFHTALSRRQQDAQELLQIIVERVGDEAAESQKQLSTAVTLPDFPLKGTLESQVECRTCGFKPAARKSDFTTLSLTVPQQSYASIDHCFDDLLKQEIIEEYKCQRCAVENAISLREKLLQKASTEASRSTTLSELDKLQQALEKDPESIDDERLLSSSCAPRRRITKFNRISVYPSVLAVHLSRSIFAARTSTKNNCRVAFSEHLRLGGLTCKHMYRLVSVVTHRGRHDSGHYETFRRQSTDGASNVSLGENAAPTGSSSAHGELVTDSKDVPNGKARRPKQRSSHKWWGISDHHVRDMRTKDVLGLQQAVYLLIYEKVQ